MHAAVLLLLLMATALPGLTILGSSADPLLIECSGLCLSRRFPDLLWACNDSGGAAMLHGLGLDGRTRRRVRIAESNNVDWEDLAAYEHGGEAFVLIADCGDNLGLRPAIGLLAIAEADLAAEDGEQTVAPRWRLLVLLPGGPTDIEAVTVDERSGRILLLSKRLPRPRLYAVALPSQASSAVRAEVLAELAPLAPLDERGAIPLAGQPTAMDLRGDQLAVVSYRRLFRWDRLPGEDWPAVVARPPRERVLEEVGACESCAWRDATRLVLLAEGERTPLLQLEDEAP